MAAITPTIVSVFKAEEGSKSFKNPQIHPTPKSAEFCIGLIHQNCGMKPPLAGKVGNRTVEIG